MGGLGLHQVAVRGAAEALATGPVDRAYAVLRRVLVLGSAGGLLVGGLYASAGPLLARHLLDSPALAAVSVLVAVWLVAQVLQTLSAEAFRGLHRLHSAAVYGGPVSVAVALAGLVALLALGRTGDLAAVVAVAAAGSATSAAVALGHLRLIERRQMRSRGAGPTDDSPPVAARPLLAVGLPLALANTLVLGFGQFDLWIVAALTPPEAVASYAVAARVATLVGLPLLVVNAVLAPRAVRLFALGRLDRLETITRLAATGAATCALLLWLALGLLGRPALRLVFGDFYASAAMLVVVLGVGQVASAALGSSGLLLAMTGRQGLLLRATAGAALVMVVLVTVLTALAGVHGAAVGAAAGFVALNLGTWWAVRRSLGIGTHVRLAGLVRTLRDLGTEPPTVGGAS